MENFTDDHHLPVNARAPPASVFAEYPLLEPPNATDIGVVSGQLGRRPRGSVLVARRCRRGKPAVVFTFPLEGEGRATPPLLWLSCPHLAAGVGSLESDGMVKAVTRRLGSDGEAAERFRADEERFSGILGELYVEAFGARVAEKLGPRGAAGGLPNAVKCLHSHLAYRLASGKGIVGTWCIEELQKRSGGIWCAKAPPACVG